MIDIELQRTRSAMAESVTLPIATWLEVLDELETLRQVEPVKHEPVAIADGTFNHNCPMGTPLYAAPIHTKDLTDAEAEFAFERGGNELCLKLRAVIAAYKEKNR